METAAARDDAVITLQVGHYANHVGAHFWNTQEASFVYAADDKTQDVAHLEVNHGVLFRQGVTPRGEVSSTGPKMTVF